jgi:hypothetical protein
MAHSGTTQSAQHCKLFHSSKSKQNFIISAISKQNQEEQNLSALGGCVLTGLMVKNDMTVAAELEKFPFGVYVLLPTICNVN